VHKAPSWLVVFLLYHRYRQLFAGFLLARMEEKKQRDFYRQSKLKVKNEASSRTRRLIKKQRGGFSKGT
jgi:hypothetical protein